MRINGHYVIQPTLEDVLAMHADDIGSKLRVCAVGIIDTYDAAKRTATVLLAENLVLNDGTVVKMDAPLLDVPVVTLQGGGVHVSFPIAPGDECLLVFADFNIDAWHAYGGQQTPPDRRQHDISDAMALVGLNSASRPILTALGASEGGLATATTKVAIDKTTGLVTVSNSTANLATALGGLLTALTALNTAIASESAVIPLSAAAAGTANTAIVAVKAQLDALLY